MTTINSSSAYGGDTAMAAMANAQYGSGIGKRKSDSWFEALADAWGRTLNAQATRIEDLSAAIGDGSDQPAVITELTAQSLRMGFLSTSSHTAISSGGEALKTMAQK
jgi:hypothetical protein